MAVEPAREVGRHQGDVARVQMADVRILNQARRDPSKRPTWVKSRSVSAS